MACFTVPMAGAVATEIVLKALGKGKGQAKAAATDGSVHIPFARKLRWLANLLWGGCALLAFEHIWHGEIIFAPPFLTAARNPEDFREMLQEVQTVGVTMLAVVLVAWLGMLAVAHFACRARKADSAEVAP